MRKKLKECNPMIINRTDLMTGKGIYVNIEIYKENCQKDCSMKSTCGVIVRLLEQNKWKQAQELLNQSKI